MLSAYSASVIPAFVNPAAGNADEVNRALRKAGCFDVRPVAPGEITQAVRAAVNEGATRIAAVGGDGTVSAAAAAIAKTGVELVVIPAGTFNHFARGNGIPTELDAATAIAKSDVELVEITAGTFTHLARDLAIPTGLAAACAIATTGTVQRADVARVNGRLFLNTSSVGVYANFVRVREQFEPRAGYWL